MTNPHGDFIWYELMTGDADAATRFYEPVIGWKVDPLRPDDDMDYRMISTGSGLVGGTLTLNSEMRQHGARPTWLGYIGVDDVDTTVSRVQTAGGRVLMPAHDLEGVGRFAMLSDPQGNPFYIMRGASADTSTAFDPAKKGHVSWNELKTSDLDAAKAFYPAVFGWTLGNVMPMGAMGDYQFIDLGSRQIGAMMKAPAGSPTGWGFAFNNDDIDGASDRIRAAGGTVHAGPMEVPGGQRVVMAGDGEGVPFMLVGK